MKKLQKFLVMVLCLCTLTGIAAPIAQAAGTVNTVNLTLKAPQPNQAPTNASVPETASTTVTDTRWVGRIWRNGKFSGPAGYGAYVTVRIKDGQDKLFAAQRSKYTITINGAASGADIGPYKAETYLMSISEDRKEIEVFVSFEMNVTALGVTGGHKILKAGDPLARDSAEERTDQTMDNITVRSIPESPDGTVQPYSWVITEMDVHAKEGYLLTSLESAKKKVGTTEAFNRYESLDLVGDLEYKDPFHVHVTFYQWIGPAKGETLTEQMKQQAKKWRAGHDGKYDGTYAAVGTGRLQDYLEPRLSEKGRKTDEEGNFFDHRAYCYSVPSMASGSDKWALMTDPVTILDDHAEAKFPGAVGRWYLVRQDKKVGYIPAAYLKDAAGGNSPADPGKSDGNSPADPGKTAAGSKIKEVALTMTPLQPGKALPTDLKVSSPSGVSVTNLQWYGGESGKLSSKTKVETGKTYVISFTVSAGKGTELGNTSQLQVTVNGQKALYTTGDKTSGDYQAVFYFEKPVEYAPEAKPAEKENYDAFDYRAYANIYPDLKAAYGYNAEKLYAHYVNYGKAEGRVGTFISGSNPKTNAPIYGVAPIPKGATLPATLLDPLPPKDPSKQAKWSEETTNYLSWSNAKLVAEYYSMKSIMDGEQRWDYLTDITAYYWQSTLPDELQDRYDAVVENNPNFFSTHGDVYGRATQSDTRILYQFFNGYKDFAAPPADPGKAGQPPVKTVGGFSDVKEEDYFAQPVVWAVEREITSGTGNGKFSPAKTCTQAQILTFLWRAAGSPEPRGTVKLEGFDGTEYYYKAAQWAAEQDMAEGGFAPNAPCTRAMAVTYLWKQAGSPAAAKASFTDVSSGADYAQAVAWAVEKGVTAGTGNGKFSPAKTCTRGQIVTFLYRAYQNK